MTEDLDARISSRAVHHGFVLSPHQAASIARYLRLLARWNERMNLTALNLAGFPDPTLDRLVIEPLAAAPLVPGGAASWLDVGSGGGSPALPLKLVAPQLRLTMVESSLRKAAFLREAVRVLMLDGVSVIAQRVETLPVQVAADLVTLRAVRIDAALQDALARLVREGGELIHFHSIDSKIVDFKELVKVAQRAVPGGRAIVTVWQRQTHG